MKPWLHTPLLERSILSFVVGFLTLIVALFFLLFVAVFISLWQSPPNMTDFPLAQLAYFVPFGYFWIVCLVAKRYAFAQLAFIRWPDSQTTP